MKKIIKLSYFLFVSLALVSCSSNDDEVFTNTIEYDGNVVDIEGATLREYSSYEDYFYSQITLEGTLGDGSIVEFYADFASKDADSFSVGTFAYYDYDDDATEHPDMFFGWSELEIDGEPLDIVGGNIVISKNSGDNSYSLSGVLTLEDGTVVTISYSGEFELEDFSNGPFKLNSNPKSSRFFSVK